MARTPTKGGAMGLAMILITAGVQQVTTSADPIVGIALVVVGGIVAVGYQFAEDHDHTDVYNDVVDAIGEDNFRELAEFSADEFRRLREDLRTPPDE